MLRRRVKICCVSSVEEAALAVQYGAAALGLVSVMPSGPGVIPEERIAAIAATIPPGVASFLLTSQQEVSAIICSGVQTNGRLDEEKLRAFFEAVQIADTA